MRVSVLGLGYVGCVTAACLARAGHEVIGCDVNPEKVSLVAAGRSPIVEPGLDALIADVVAAGRLQATTSPAEAVAGSELSLVCVGTPSRPNGQLDLTALERVGEALGQAVGSLDRSHLVVLRSTVLPGTTEHTFIPAIERGAGHGLGGRVGIAVNPEFMREGSSLQDFAAPPITVVGSDSAAVADKLRELYASVQAPFVHTSVRTAEMTKYVSNAFHALKVCFANEVGNVATALGADAQEVMRLFLLDRKLNVSEAYLRPGFAFGGSCLPKDVRALQYAARAADVTVPLLSGILPSNELQVRLGVEAVLSARRRRVGVVGLSFKSGTDDLRESPMVVLVETLIGKGCDVRILDRNVSIARLVGANRRYIEHEIPHIASLMCSDPGALVHHAEILVIGNPGEEAAAVLAAAGPAHLVVDLTRGAAGYAPRPARSSP